MKKSVISLISILLLITLFSSHTNRANQQNIAAFGVIKHENEKVSGVSVKVFHQRKLVEHMVTSRNRGYGFTLEYNTDYTIEIAKEGFLKEIILIDTKVPQDVLTLGDQILWEPDFILYKIMPGMDFDEFAQPVARYTFDEEYWGFLEDKSYQASVKPMISGVNATIKKLKTKAYNSVSAKADSLYNSGNYEEAIIAYEEAGKYNKDAEYPETQIKSAKKLLRSQYTIDEGYRKAIQKADEDFAENKYESATDFYQKALIYKPKETYPLDQLFAIDSIKSYQWIEKNNTYDDFIASADALFSDEKYDDAVITYNNALDIFPDKTYPRQMLNRIDSMEKAKAREIKLLAAQMAEDEKRRQEEQEAELKQADQVSSEQAIAITNGRKKTEPDHEIVQKHEEKTQEAEPLTALSEPIQNNENVIAKDDTVQELSQSEEKAEVNLMKLREALEIKLKTDDKLGSSKILEEMGQIYQSEFMLNEALESYNQSLEIHRDLGDKEGEAEVLSSIAAVMYDSGSYKAAIENFEQSLRLTQELNNKQKSSELLSDIAIVYENTYRYDEAIENLEQSLEIKKEIGDMEGASEVHKTMGNIYYEQNKFDEAIKEMESSLRIDEERGNREEVSATLNNLGASYYNMHQYDKAVEYYEQALEVTRETNNLRDESITLNNIGNINFNLNKYTEAIEYYEKSLKIKTELSFHEGVASTLHNIGNSYFKLGEFKKALEYYIRSQEIAEASNYREVIWRNYEAFAKTYAALGNYKSAFDNYQLYADTRFEFDKQDMQLVELREQYESSMMAVRSLKRELRKQNQLARYEAAKNRQAMQIITLEMENKQQQLNKQRILIISFIAVLLIILVFAIIITRQYRQKHKAYNIVAEQKKHITDGISYAARIQSAVLPPEKHLENLLPEHFIINKPREQVGGDFYWAARHLGKSVIAVADCTGHGVPGGFMSMLGIAILNEIISTDKPLETHEILTQLRVRVMDALHQKKGSAEAMDGMDISLLIYDPKTRNIQFSGAYHTLYLIRNQEIELIKGDRIPIGYHFATKEFTSQNLQLEEGDMLYMTSDGFIDQIGEKTNKRFMYSRFKDELLSISRRSLIDQKKHLEEVLADWKGAQEQTDDILVMGMRV